jgi:spore photoproduct lyase
MDIIYVESGIKEHPRTQFILQKFKKATVIECRHYGEVFNVKSQNFKLQKQNPCLIIAKKQNN